jgi:hypothetical protein
MTDNKSKSHHGRVNFAHAMHDAVVLHGPLHHHHDASTG